MTAPDDAHDTTPKPISNPSTGPSISSPSDNEAEPPLHDLEASLPAPKFQIPSPVPLTPEPFRDISFLGPLTLHRFFALLWIVGSGVLFYYIQEWIWPEFLTDPDEVWPGWPYVGLIWLVSLPASLATVVGIIWFRYDTKLDDVLPIHHNVAFRIVSRGTNAECLLETIRRCQTEMTISPMFPYIVEVVTDGDVFEVPEEPDLIQLKVPSDYRTPNGTLFKARALHYACEYSTVPPNTWIVHLDEETQPTSSGIKGIAKMIGECETSGNVKRVGQGCILYHRSFEKHPFLTLADMRRTGDDLGQFFLQHNLGITLFGLHGAFIVCRQDVEAKIGFDLGPAGSITEDAWWVLLAMKEKYRTKWIDGYLEEQSTQSLMDFLKQRRRWYYGLSKVISSCPVNFKYRLVLFWNTVTWLLVPVLLPIQIGLTVLLYIFEFPVVVPIRILTNLIVSTSMLIYFSGLVPNMWEHGMSWWRMIMWSVGMLIALPFCMGMEIASVILSLFAPCTQGGKGFHVVQKSASKESEERSGSSSDSSDEIEGKA